MPPRPVDVLLAGGGVAAARCARTLRRRGFAGSILLVGDESDPPYNRPPLSKELLRGDVPDELVAVEPEAWYARRRVELATATAVIAIDPAQRVAVLRQADRRESEVRFERCLLATGAEAVRPPIPGAEQALLLRTLADARAIRERAVAGRTAVVVGGGFIGIEVAASLASRGMSVTLLERERALWGGSLGSVVSGWAARALARAGVTVMLEADVTRIEPGGVLVGSDEELLGADLILSGVGVRPRVALGEAAGLETRDGIVVDERQATTAPGIFAAGDVARPRDGVRVEHWHAARETGERAALAMLAEEPDRRRAPWVFSDFGDAHLDVIGLAEAGTEAQLLGDAQDERFVAAWSGAGGRVVQLAIGGNALAPEVARALVEDAATVVQCREAVARAD